MIAAPLAALVLAAATASATPAASPASHPLAPAAVISSYAKALAALREPRVFAVEYAVLQSGPRRLEQRHRIFRSGRDERDETLAVNGASSRRPVVRIFRGRPYRYTVAALAPKPSLYDFAFVGPRRAGKHVDYVFALRPKAKPPALAFTSVTIDGVTFLPQSVSFAMRRPAATGSVQFAKSDRYWVARSAAARAAVGAGTANEQIAFSNWRFPPSLPPSTFAIARPLPTPPPPVP